MAGAGLEAAATLHDPRYLSRLQELILGRPGQGVENQAVGIDCQESRATWEGLVS